MAIVRVAIKAAGESSEFDLQAPVSDSIYHIDDGHPSVYFRCSHSLSTGNFETGEISPMKESNELFGEDLWYKWTPLSKTKISADRRFGLYETLLSPGSIPLRVYLWPARLFSRAQLSLMAAAIEAELNRPILWERGDLAVRAYVIKSRASSQQPARLLDLVRAELSAVRDLQRVALISSPTQGAIVGDYTEGGSEQQLSESQETLAEDSLVALWSASRLDKLRSLQRELEVARQSQEKAVSDLFGNNMKREVHIAALKTIKASQQHVARNAALLRTISAYYSGARSAFHIVPSMQRDHRLRMLLAALRHAENERLAEIQAEFSSLPPLKATDLFELWGAVSIVNGLRSLGWAAEILEVGASSEHWGAAALDSCCWRLSKGGDSIVFDYSPRPKTVDPATIPGIHERTQGALAWASKTLKEADVLYSLGPQSPDYVFRWRSGSARALIIGDASLADPKHQKGQKITAVCAYRPVVAWLADNGKVVRCDEGGASFVLMPGPRGLWQAVEKEAATADCYALLPEAGADSHEDLVTRLEHLIESLPREAST